MASLLNKLEALAFLERLAESYGDTIEHIQLRHIEVMLYEYVGAHPQADYSDSKISSESDLQMSFMNLLEDEGSVFIGHSLSKCFWEFVVEYDLNTTLEKMRRQLQTEVAQDLEEKTK